MTRPLRLVLVVLAGFAALAFAGSAFAAYTPRLLVSHGLGRLGQSAQTIIEYHQERTDEALARLTIYVPLGYGVSTSMAAGTQIGAAQATVQARAVSPDIFLPVTGTIQADAPATYAAQATSCTGTATHQAVFVLVLQASGRELRVPIFVDPAAGGETAFASFKMVICLPPPDIPEAAGGAAFGAKLVDASLVFNAGVFTNPASANIYLWRGVATPWTNHKPPVNAAGTVEARTAVALPVSISLTARWDAKRRVARLSGRITIPGVTFQGVALPLFSGARPAVLKRSGSTSRTTRNGSFAAVRKIARATYFQVRIPPSVFEATQDVCGLSPPVAPAGCVSGFLGLPQAQSPARKVTPKRKK